MLKMYYCCVKYCRTKSSDASLFLFPKVNSLFSAENQNIQQQRREAWLRAIAFKNKNVSIETLDTYRICGNHFKSGVPAHYLDVTNDDWIPSIEVKPDAVPETPKGIHIREKIMIRSRFLKKKKLFHNEEENENAVEVPITEDTGSELQYADASTQTEISVEDILHLQKENCELKAQLKVLKCEEESFTSKNTKKFTYYTGLPNIELFLLILNQIEGFLGSVKIRKLSNFQKLMLVLMKLRLNLDFEDLGYRFNIRSATVSSMFKKVIICLSNTFGSLVLWPEREALCASMPSCFKLKFGNRVAVIIDCFEIPTQRPSLIRSKVQTYSQYKSRTTLKYLLGITPQGVVCFLSEGWGGRTSDKYITEHCGILDNLLKGDIVLADRGFDIHVLVGEKHASLNIPDFTRGKKQLSPYEVANTRKIASVRIHVERVIGVVRNKFKIINFNSPVPIRFLNKMYENKSLFDYIVRVCCVLYNLCDSIIDD